MPRLLGMFVMLSACATMRPALPRDNASRQVRVRMQSADCPLGFLHAELHGYAGDGRSTFRVVESSRDGVFDLPVADAAYEAEVYGCGRVGKYVLNGWEDMDLTWQLPPRSPRLPQLPSAPWSMRVVAPPPSRCQLLGHGAREHIVTGAASGLRRDPAACGLRFHQLDSEWLYTPERAVIRLGTYVTAENESRVIALEAPSTVVSVDRKTGARTVVAEDRRGSLSPRTNVLVLQSDDGGILELQVPGGKMRRVAEHARAVTWNEAGTRLAYYDETESTECPTLRVVEPTGDDRAGPRACGVVGWGPPQFTKDDVVGIGAKDSYRIVNAATGQLLPPPPPRAFEGTHPVPGGSIGFRPSPHLQGCCQRGLADAFFVDAVTGAVTTVAEGVREGVLASPGGVLVFEEDFRLIVRRIGEARSVGVPSFGGARAVSFSSDERWVHLQETSKGSMWFEGMAALDGRHRVQTTRGELVPGRDMLVSTSGGGAPTSLERQRADADGTFPESSETIARGVPSFALFDGAQIVYAKDDGLYLDSLDTMHDQTPR